MVAEIIQCLKEENNIDISEEEANEYLDSFAGLFLAFSGFSAVLTPRLNAGAERRIFLKNDKSETIH